MPYPASGSASLEKILQSELDQARVGPRRRTGDRSEIRIVRGATGCVWRSKLRAIEQIEEFHSRLNSRTTLASEDGPFENGKIKIDYAVRAQC